MCKDVDLSSISKGKRSKVDVVDKTFYTRYAMKYFVEVIRKLTVHRRGVIEKFGFGSLLLLDLHYIPSEFARWVAGCFDPLRSQFLLHYQPVDFSKHTVNAILGVPVGGLDLCCNTMEGEDFILSHFQLKSMPHITFFGNRLRCHNALSEHDITVCFMIVAMHCFMCPSVKEQVDGNYLAVLRHPDSAKGYDFSKLVYEQCINGVSEFTLRGRTLGRRSRVPVCCNFVLAVRYLDSLDFGSQNIANFLPRISIWKGNMIKYFSELDQRSHHVYGRRIL